VSGLTEAIRLVSDWLVKNRTKPETEMNWPYFVPLVRNQNELTPDTTSPLAPSKTAWCYGSPGVAKALWFAGKSLDDKSLIDLSIAAIKNALAKPAAERHISGVSLCHGNAGLLQLALRFGRDSEDTELLDHVSNLVQQIVDEYDEASILGFRIPNSVGGYFDRPSFLEGAAGAVLALLSATTEIEPTWDRILLMS
jgi:lantibiotic modifying enzyme